VPGAAAPTGGAAVTPPDSTPLRLHPDDVAAIAAAIARLLRDEPPPAAPLLTADEVASSLGVTADWVRVNGELLGGVRLGTGPKAHWRFDLAKARAAMTARSTRRQSPAAESAESLGAAVLRQAGWTPGGSPRARSAPEPPPRGLQ